MSAFARRIAVVSLLLGATAQPSSGQRPKSVDPKPTVAPRGALDPARQRALTVDPPAALSRTELIRRLKALDGSFPNVLPAGGSVILTPGSLQRGRTNLGIYGAELVALNRRGAAVADYTEAHEAGTEGIYLEFDAGGPSRYAVDFLLAGTEGPNLGGSFDVAVWGSSHSTVTSVVPSADGHLLYLFDLPRAGRYTLNVERRPYRNGRWYFYRVELLRVR